MLCKQPITPRTLPYMPASSSVCGPAESTLLKGKLPGCFLRAAAQELSHSASINLSDRTGPWKCVSIAQIFIL